MNEQEEKILDFYNACIDEINKAVKNKNEDKIMYYTGMCSAFRISLLTLGIKRLKRV